MGRTIEEALASLDDGDPDVEDELVAEGSIASDEYASPEGSSALDPEHRTGRDRSSLSCHSPDPAMVTASARRGRVVMNELTG